MRKVHDEIILDPSFSFLKHIYNQYSSDIAVQQYGDPIQVEMYVCRNVSGIDKHNNLIYSTKFKEFLSTDTH